MGLWHGTYRGYAGRGVHRLSPKQIRRCFHSRQFQTLSRCRTHPVDLASIMRGVIDETDLRTIRVAGTAEAYMGTSASPVQPEPWDSTNKHKVMWLVPDTLVVAAIKGKGKGASDKGNTGS